MRSPATIRAANGTILRALVVVTATLLIALLLPPAVRAQATLPTGAQTGTHASP